MFSQRVFNLVSHLIFSRWARDYEEHHGQCEDTYAARLGLLQLEINRCFVLDHDDAFISIRIPTPRGKLHLGYVVCLGDEQVRQSGVDIAWFRPSTRSKVISDKVYSPADDEYFPF